jgi:signal transduction histidine kinase
MVVEGNGKGFELSKIPENRINRGNGLKNMQARTEKLGGKLEIISKINQGTKIQLVFEL